MLLGCMNHLYRRLAINGHINCNRLRRRNRNAKDDGGCDDLGHNRRAPDLPFLMRAYTSGLQPDHVAASKKNGLNPSVGAYPIKLGEIVEMVFVNVASTAGHVAYPTCASGVRTWTSTYCS